MHCPCPVREYEYSVVRTVPMQAEIVQILLFSRAIINSDLIY